MIPVPTWIISQRKTRLLPEVVGLGGIIDLELDGLGVFDQSLGVFVLCDHLAD